MKKHSQYLMKIAVGLIIFLGVLIILFTNEKSFKSIVADDIENISKLSSSIIYAEIDNSLTQPIFVGLTMANDRFLKGWLREEAADGASAEQNELMRQYLMDYSNKYNYDSVFLTSEKSGIYYSQDGINKVVSTENAHDVWYYDFMASKKAYDLDVDFDEVNDNQLTVFTNCLITDENNTPMGAVGVGIKMSYLQAMLQSYEEKYDLKACLINEDGLVQVDSLAENIETVNFFDMPERQELRDRIIGNKTSPEIFWYPEGGMDHCLIMQYVSNLDWYIVIEKNTKQIQDALNGQIRRDLWAIGIIIIIVLVIISLVMGKYNRMLLRTASIDDVTALPNVKMFQEIFERNKKRPACQKGMIFMFDIDGFKDINDRFGHMFGNTILYRISEVSRRGIGDDGVVARWGGDEFFGIIYDTKEETSEILHRVAQSIFDISEGALTGITISIGVTENKLGASLDAMLREADTAMYRAKRSGKNTIVFYDASR